MALPTSLPTFETLLYDVQDGIATVTLHRPEKMNAFTTQMRDDLVAVFDETDRNDDVRVVIITGAGKAFCAGADRSAARPSTTTRAANRPATSTRSTASTATAAASPRCASSRASSR